MPKKTAECVLTLSKIILDVKRDGGIDISPPDANPEKIQINKYGNKSP